MSPRHCSQCGTPMVWVHLDGRQREQCPACRYIDYRNPAPVGMAVIEHGGQLVLIRRSADPLANYWAPPAGYVECGESVPQAVVREAREECGLEIELDGLIAVYSQAEVNVLIIAYRARSVGGELRAGDDASEAAVFPPGRVPVQSAPETGTATDRWFYEVIQHLTAPWRT